MHNNNNNNNNNNNGRGLSNLQFNFHRKLPLESLSKWLKPLLIETEENLPKLTKSTKIARTQSTTMDQSQPRLREPS